MTFVLVETTESFFEHQMVMPTDVPVLTITEAASLFPNDCMVPLALTEAPASALGELSEDALLKLRMCAPRPARLQSAFTAGSYHVGMHTRARVPRCECHTFCFRSCRPYTSPMKE